MPFSRTFGKQHGGNTSDDHDLMPPLGHTSGRVPTVQRLAELKSAMYHLVPVITSLYVLCRPLHDREYACMGIGSNLGCIQGAGAACRQLCVVGSYLCQRDLRAVNNVPLLFFQSSGVLFGGDRSREAGLALRHVPGHASLGFACCVWGMLCWVIQRYWNPHFWTRGAPHACKYGLPRPKRFPLP